MSDRNVIDYLSLSQEEFEQLHQDVDKVRSTSKTVKVSAAAVRKILSDHSKLVAHSKGRFA